MYIKFTMFNMFLVNTAIPRATSRAKNVIMSPVNVVSYKACTFLKSLSPIKEKQGVSTAHTPAKTTVM